MDLILKYSVLSAQTNGNSTVFIIKHIESLITSNVRRVEDGDAIVWECSCGSNGTEKGTDYSQHRRFFNRCFHIDRAWHYYTNMLAREKQLKEQLRLSAEQTKEAKEMLNEETPPLFSKRKIRLED